MFISTPPFVDDFARCLGSRNWLPFVTPVHGVIKPRVGAQAVRTFTKNGTPFVFQLVSGDGNPFAQLAVSPQRVGFSDGLVHRDPACFVVVDIQAMRPNRWAEAVLDLQTEVARRSVWYAFTHGRERVIAPIPTDDSRRFWLGLGFSTEAVDVKNPFLMPDPVPCEKGELSMCPLPRHAVLDLSQSAKRAYVFHRLGLV